ncbi:MAG: hypothetical protein ACRCYO_12410 [Bacteroidia bacterium]
MMHISDKSFFLVISIGIAYLLLGLVQLILALIFTIQRKMNGKGTRGWMYYWIWVGIYFIVLFGFSFFGNISNGLYNGAEIVGEANAVQEATSGEYHANSSSIPVQMIWSFSSLLIAIYFFFAGKVSDLIARKKQIQ